MKKTFLTLAVLSTLLSCKKDKVDQCDCSQYENLQQKNGKVTVCHKGKDLEISESALQEHLQHGDILGSCDTLGVDDIEFDECYNWCLDND